MKIVNHRLLCDDNRPCHFESSPNVGGQVQHEYLIIHYTAGSNAESSINHLTDRRSRASAHVVIGRDGKITQLVPFNKVAWHAGVSRWGSRQGLNHCSLGIELDNAGKLTRQGSRWRAWFGREYADDEVMEACHRDETQTCGWQIFTPEQLEAAIELSLLLIDRYELRDVLGHEDISPGRKVDPGPAFPMSSFRARVLGRKEDAEQYLTTDIAGEGLNIRSGPGTQHGLVPGGPLPKGTRVQALAQRGDWRQVEVVDAVNGVNDMQGWVHSRYLQPVA